MWGLWFGAPGSELGLGFAAAVLMEGGMLVEKFAGSCTTAFCWAVSGPRGLGLRVHLEVHG